MSYKSFKKGDFVYSVTYDVVRSRIEVKKRRLAAAGKKYFRYEDSLGSFNYGVGRLCETVAEASNTMSCRDAQGKCKSYHDYIVVPLEIDIYSVVAAAAVAMRRYQWLCLETSGDLYRADWRKRLALSAIIIMPGETIG